MKYLNSSEHIPCSTHIYIIIICFELASAIMINDCH